MTRKNLFKLIGVAIILSLVFIKIWDSVQKATKDSGEVSEHFENENQTQSITELGAIIRYGDKKGNTVNYYILKTTYYEAVPTKITGLNKNAIAIVVNPNTADACREMKIQDWYAALYEKGELSYLCWTYSPEISYILEYNPAVIPDEEIIKMAENARPLNEE